MTPPPLGRALRAALALAVLSLAAPGVARASTLTVDDDRAQCPSAGFTSVQSAVDQAAPWDTIIVCDGVYREQSTPPYGNAQSFAQPGSRNGLTITKPLTIKGAGADRVTIMPAAELGESLAGTAPYLRDGGGNVITVSRQSLGASDDNENFFSLSGVTVASPNAYVEAGIAFFNTSGEVVRSVVGPLRRASADQVATRPHGWGVVQANSLQSSTQGGIRREVTVRDSLVTGFGAGGVLFDASRGGPDGDALNATRSNVNAYGRVLGSRIVGAKGGAAVNQTGVQFNAGQRGRVADAEIVDTWNGTSGTARASVGVLLTDAEIGADPSDPASPALAITGTAFRGTGYAVFNADATNAAVRLGAPVPAAGNWWGCAAGPTGGANGGSASSATTFCQGRSGLDSASAPSVDVSGALTTEPAPASLPAATPDAAPTAEFLDPIAGLTVPVGQELSPVVEARDDFGVRSVELRADGVPVATLAKAPYEFRWTPTAAQAGSTVTLQAIVTDSAGQTTTTEVPVVVPAPPGTGGGTDTTPVVPAVPVPVSVTPPALSGSDRVGGRASCTAGAWTGAPTSFAFQWLRDGEVIAGQIGSSYKLRTADLGARIGCRVTATNAGGPSAGATSTTTAVRYTPTTSPSATQLGVGPAIVRLYRSVKPSRTGRVGLGTVTCAGAGAGRCTIAVTATVRIGGSRSTVAVTRSLPSGGRATLRGTLKASARRALRSAGRGRLSVRIVVTPRGGAAVRSAAVPIALRR
jgi:hypothetical protein